MHWVQMSDLHVGGHVSNDVRCEITRRTESTELHTEPQLSQAAHLKCFERQE